VSIGASRRLRWAVGFAQIGLMPAIWLMTGSEAWFVGLTGIAALHAWWLDRRLAHPTVERIELVGDECLLCSVTQCRPFRLQAATVWSWFTLLQLRDDHRTHYLYLLPDNTDADAFRQLRIWLGWQSPFVHKS